MTHLQHYFPGLDEQYLTNAYCIRKVLDNIEQLDFVSVATLTNGLVYRFDFNRHPLMPSDWCTGEVSIKIDPEEEIDTLKCHFSYAQIDMDSCICPTIEVQCYDMKFENLIPLLKLFGKIDINQVLNTHEMDSYERYTLSEIIEDFGLPNTAESFDAYKKLTADQDKISLMRKINIELEKAKNLKDLRTWGLEDLNG